MRIVVLLLMSVVSVIQCYGARSEYLITVSPNQTGTVDGYANFCFLGHVGLKVWSPQLGEVASLDTYTGVATGVWYWSAKGVSGSHTVDLPNGQILWKVEGLPPGTYFLVYEGGEPNVGVEEVQYLDSLIGLLADFWINDPNNEGGPPSDTVLIQMQSASWSQSFWGDPTQFIVVQFASWID